MCLENIYFCAPTTSASSRGGNEDAGSRGLTAGDMHETGSSDQDNKQQHKPRVRANTDTKDQAKPPLPAYCISKEMSGSY